MIVHTNITRMDVFWMFLRQLPRQKSTRRLWMTISIVVLVLSFAQGGIPSTPFGWLWYLSSSVTTGLAFTLVGIGCSLLLLMLTLRKGNGTLGEHTLMVTEDGLREQTSYNDSLIRWKGITSIVTTRRAVLFQVNTNNYHVVPYRSFRSDSERAQFLGLAQSYWEIAQQ